LRQSSAQDLCERYGDRGQFLQTFAVVQQLRHVSAPERCVLGSAPKLQEVNDAYGQGTAEEWLLYQITDMSEFVGARDKMQPWKLKALARNFVLDYSWLRVTDVELFMHRLKQGAYGHFYGSVDPQRLMGCITPFLQERNGIIAEAVEREERERRKHLLDGCISWEEYHAQNPTWVNPFEELRQLAEERQRQKEEAARKRRERLRQGQQRLQQMVENGRK